MTIGSADMGEFFRCTRLSATLTRATCAKRSASASGAATPLEAISYRPFGCDDCPVGAAHRRGLPIVPAVAPLIPAGR